MRVWEELFQRTQSGLEGEDERKPEKVGRRQSRGREEEEECIMTYYIMKFGTNRAESSTFCIMRNRSCFVFST